MNLTEYIILFVLTATTGAGVPGPGHVFGRHNFAASVTMPAYVSGIFRVKFPVRIGNTGAKAVLGVAVVVAAGLGIKAGLSRWRATRQSRESEMV